LYRADGSRGVSSHLKAEGASYRKNGNNSWEVAAFEALSDSTFFCDEYQAKQIQSDVVHASLSQSSQL
jgi:hypothetical protein